MAKKAGIARLRLEKIPLWSAFAAALGACAGANESNESATGTLQPGSLQPGSLQPGSLQPGESPVEAALRVTAPPFELATPTPFYRIDLRRSADGTLSTARVENVLLARQPLPALNPEYLLVAYAAGSVVSSVPLAFPRALLGVGSDNGVRTHLRQPLSEALTSVFIAADPSVDRVAVLATDGAALLELAAADLPAPSHEKARDPLPLSPYGRARQRLRAGELQASYEHIHFLDSAESAFLPQDALAGGRVVDPSEEMNDVISDGLAAVAPALLGSVQTLAVVEWLAGSRQDELLGFATGPVLMLNARRMQDPEMVPTIVHETAHNLQDLTDAAADAPAQTHGLGEWTDDVARPARALVQRFDLARGLVSTWRSLHNSGRSSSLTADYFKDEPTPSRPPDSLTLEAARKAGFATRDGSVSAWEDMAEYVGTVQAPSDVAPGICPVFAGGGEVTPAVGIPYAKLILLLGVGAITEAAFQACVQATQLPQQTGIHFDNIAFSSGLKAGFLPADVGRSYGILGAGPNSYQLLVKVWVPDSDPSALGLRRVPEVLYAGADGSALAGAFLSNDEPLRARVSQGGLMLLTDARPERTAGAIFGLVLQNAAGNPTDSGTLGNFRIP